MLNTPTFLYDFGVIIATFSLSVKHQPGRRQSLFPTTGKDKKVEYMFMMHIIELYIMSIMNTVFHKNRNELDPLHFYAKERQQDNANIQQELKRGRRAYSA